MAETAAPEASPAPSIQIAPGIFAQLFSYFRQCDFRCRPIINIRRHAFHFKRVHSNSREDVREGHEEKAWDEKGREGRTHL